MIRRPPRSTLFPTRRSSDLLEVSQSVLTHEWSPAKCQRKGDRMDGSLKRKVVAGAAAALAVGGAGAGIAATKLSHSPREESQAVVNDAAKQLGVEPSKLSAALKKAYEDRVDAAVADGTITKAEGKALKQRLESNGLPLVAPPLGFRHFGFHDHGPPGLPAAAKYLDLSETQLESKLESGKTLAQVAEDQGKSVDGPAPRAQAHLKRKTGQ